MLLSFAVPLGSRNVKFEGSKMQAVLIVRSGKVDLLEFSTMSLFVSVSSFTRTFTFRRKRLTYDNDMPPSNAFGLPHYLSLYGLQCEPEWKSNSRTLCVRLEVRSTLFTRSLSSASFTSSLH